MQMPERNLADWIPYLSFEWKGDELKCQWQNT